jgi:hypothetical protein
MAAMTSRANQELSAKKQNKTKDFVMHSAYLPGDYFKGLLQSL